MNHVFHFYVTHRHKIYDDGVVTLTRPPIALYDIMIGFIALFAILLRFEQNEMRTKYRY